MCLSGRNMVPFQSEFSKFVMPTLARVITREL